MDWKQVSEYADQAGPWTIALYFSQSAPIYGLWFKNRNLGYFKTKEEAKQHADSELIGIC